MTGVAIFFILLIASPVLCSPTCPNAVPNLRRLRDEFKASASFRLINIRSRLMREANMFKKEQVGASAWILTTFKTPENIVCTTKQLAMEQLIVELETRQNITENVLLNISDACFQRAARKSMIDLYGFQDKIFLSENHEGIFFVAFITMLSNLSLDLKHKNVTFFSSPVADILFQVSEHVADNFANRLDELQNKNAFNLELQQISMKVVNELMFYIDTMFSNDIPLTNIYSLLIISASTLLTFLVLPIFASFYYKHRKIYEVFYLALLAGLDAIIGLLFLFFNYTLDTYFEHISWFQCLILITTADHQFGFDVRTVASISLQAVLSIEKFVQIWRISKIKDVTPYQSKGYWRIARACICFFVTICFMITLQGITLGFYVNKQDFASVFIIKQLKEIFPMPYAGRYKICGFSDLGKIHQHDIFTWLQRSFAIISSFIAIVFNIFAAVLLKRNSEPMNKKGTASSKYFFQIILCTGLISFLVIGVTILVIIEIFVTIDWTMIISVSLTNIVIIVRNVIYIATSKNLRAHIRQMICKK